jgi:hypothetical protein
MSAEPAAAMPTATEPVPDGDEKKIEASEAPSQPKQAPLVEDRSPASADTPLSKLFAELHSIIKGAEHKEIWGVELSDASHVPTSIVLEKFLRANAKDVAKAKAQLIEALKWRKKVDPAKLLAETEFNPAKFGDLGYVTVYPKTQSHEKEIVTWNIYGAVKDFKETFGNVEQYVRSSRLIYSAHVILDLSNGVLL